jgi:hypothetical protein
MVTQEETMDALVTSLGPAFAAGFAVQRLLELLDPVFANLADKTKKRLLGFIALGVGLLLSYMTGIRVMNALGVNAGVADPIITGLIISAGTEGFNSIMKFLGYVKEKEKADAALKMDEANEKAGDEMEKL